MKKRILGNISYFISLGLGIFTYILLAIPYLRVKISDTSTDIVSEYIKPTTLNGYDIMNLWDNGFSGVVTSLLQIMIILCSLALIFYGIIGILIVFKVIHNLELPEGLPMKKIGNIIFYTFGIVNVLLLVFLIIFATAHTRIIGQIGNGSIKQIVSINAGVFIMLIFSFAAIVASKIIESNYRYEEKIIRCSQCGLKLRRSFNFCPKCGKKLDKYNNKNGQ